MIPRPWRWGALLVLVATATGWLATRLAFAPVPWPDGSAFYLPGLEGLDWPPEWRMHAQAAFVPSYDQANFNLMPALPLVLGIAARLGLPAMVTPALLIRILSVPALLAWAWLLWRWLIECLQEGKATTHTMAVASAVALAGLWDPVLRWGTLVVRTETWIGLCWLWCLREMHRWETCDENPAEWPRIAWRISGGLALAAYFHFEAAYLIPAAIVGLGFAHGWPRRLVGIGWRTCTLLLPWILYAACNARLFSEQMEIQFYRLAHGNAWIANPYLLFHSLFLEHGSPIGAPKFFNLAKGMFWIGIVALGVLSVLAAVFSAAASAARTSWAWRPRRALLASAVAFASCFYLWITKAEVWFITLCHLTYWPWLAAALIGLGKARSRSTLARGARLGWRAAVGLSGAYALIGGLATLSQARAISPEYTWTMYNSWVDCLEGALGPLDSKPGLKLWQPYVPDTLVELSRRHPDWDLTRALDFPNRKELALARAREMDAIFFTRFFNPGSEATSYTGPLRESDRIKLTQEEDSPFGQWALKELIASRAAPWRAQVCEVGPFWAVVAAHDRR